MASSDVSVGGNVVFGGNDYGQGEGVLEKIGNRNGFVLGCGVDDDNLEVFVDLSGQTPEEFGKIFFFVEGGDDDGEERSRFIHAFWDIITV